MKKLLFLIIIIVGLGLVAPFFIGNQAETEFRKLYAQLNLGPDVSFEVTEYNKGWFSSTATVAAVVNMGVLDPQKSDRFTAYFKHNIQHGPLLTQTKALGVGILDVDMTIEAPSVISSEYPELNTILNNIISFATRVAMNGDLFTIMNINAYQHTEDEVTLDLKSGQVNLAINDNKRIVGDGDWAGLSMSQNNREYMSFGPVSMKADLESMGEQALAINGIVLGTSSATVGELKLTGGNAMESATVKNIAVTSGSSVNDDVLNMAMDLTIDEINALGLTFSNFIFDQSLNSLNVVALQKVNNLANQMKGAQMSEEETQALQVAAMELLQSKPEILINKLGVTTAQGDIDSSAKITIEPELVDPNNPLTVMTALEIEASGTIPEAFLQSMGIMPMLSPYVTEGLLKVENGEVKFDMVFEGGQMMLFGKPYSWSQMMN